MMKKLSLGGSWTLQQVGSRKQVSSVVPGDVYADLLRAGAIPDPFYRDNENQLQWIGESGWRYSRSFDVSADLLAHEEIRLCCEGLDTLATVRINGQMLGETDNMFRTWEWDVKRFLRSGVNRIQVDFASTIPYIERREKQRHLPGWNGEIMAAHYGWIRKQQCNYGWDWGIKAVTCGIWRPIQLAAFDTARIADIRVEQNHTIKGQVGLAIHVTTEKFTSKSLVARVAVRHEGKVVAQTDCRFRGATGMIELAVHEPKLWWPAGMGNQPLYDVKVELLDGDENRLDRMTRRIGLRTLRLDRHKDQWGESFQFVSNGVPFFTKGANWIPADAILARMTSRRYRQLIEAAVEANMNMLRVWGGGIYEDDVFYDICDELGICVWQDFMFACSGYPTWDKEFMANVAAEAQDNIRRLRHHACLALWCGNNELEMGLVGPEHTETQISWDEYGKLFDTVLAKIVRQEDAGRDYWPGSPHSPHGPREICNSDDCGDAHLWSVWFGNRPFEWYRLCKHRFCSEFGFQSFPEPRTVRGYTASEDRNITSRVMEHHQRSGIGNRTIIHHMLEWFRLPTGFDNTLWVSQILQGTVIRYACEHWRRSMPRSMGAIYWQFNDTWPIASWSSIDYDGRWKALHYFARRFFSPLMISGVEDTTEGTVDIHVTSDRLEPIRTTVRWSVTDLSGKKLTDGKKVVIAKASGNRLVKTLHLRPLIDKVGANNLLVWLELDADGAQASNNLVLFARPKHMDFSRKPGIVASASKQDDGSFSVTLVAKRPALWCWLELDGMDVHLSDNFVHLRPGAAICIIARPHRKLTLAEFRKRLIVRSLVDTYAEPHS